jgi:hypothetical protein
MGISKLLCNSTLPQVIDATADVSYEIVRTREMLRTTSILIAIMFLLGTMMMRNDNPQQNLQEANDLTRRGCLMTTCLPHKDVFHRV